MKARQYPSQERIQELFTYSNGNLIWKAKSSIYSNIKIGTIAGCDSGPSNYVFVSVDNVTYSAHRLVWIYHYGDIPVNRIMDHKNRIKNDNIIDNLRLATYSQNNFNTDSKGWSYNTKKKLYKVVIGVKYKYKFIGWFKTKEEARLAYIEAKKKYHKI